MHFAIIGLRAPAGTASFPVRSSVLLAATHEGTLIVANQTLWKLLN